MLVHVTGIPGSGKSTLRAELERRGYRAVDADEGFCAWFDQEGRVVAELPLSERTPGWYAQHRWRLLAEPVQELAGACADGLGFLLGVAANAGELSAYFDRGFYLTAGTEVIVARLRGRDGEAYATRFAASASVREWQRAAEQRWTAGGYAPVDASGTPGDVADALIGRLAASRR